MTFAGRTKDLPELKLKIDLRMKSEFSIGGNMRKKPKKCTVELVEKLGYS